MTPTSRIGLACLATLLACDGPTPPSTFGSLDLRVVVAPGGIDSLQSGIVRLLDGPSQKSPQTVTPGQPVTIDRLLPGTYAVVLEGFIDTEVVYFGKTPNIQVNAGQTATPSVNFDVFVPAIDSLRATGTAKTYTVYFKAILGIASYKVDWAEDASFTTNLNSLTTSQLSVTITAPNYGGSFVRVRAIDPYGPTGRASLSQSIVLTPPPVINLSKDSVLPNVRRGDPTYMDSVIVTNGGGGTLSGLSVTAPSYSPGQPTGWLVATLSAPTAPSKLILQATPGSLPETTYTATVNVLSLVAANSPRTVAVAFTINTSADYLIFTGQPTNAVAGKTISPVQVAAKDVLGSTVASFTDSVRVAITSGSGTSGAGLSGTVTRVAVAGVATFNDLNIDKSGTGYTLQASALVGGTTILAPASNAFNITPDTATHLAFTVQPGGAQADSVFAPPVKVSALDARNNVATSFSRNVTVAIGTNPPGNGILSGTLIVVPAAGVATFPNLRIDKAGIGYTLTANVTGLTGAVSGAFNIISSAISPTLSTVVANPGTIPAGSGASTITVTAKDGSGNPVQGATVSLSATGSGNSLTQPGTATNAQGVASGSLSSTVAEQKTVTATINGVIINQQATVTVTTSGCTNCWTSRAPLLTPRTGHGIGVVNGRMFAVGGYNGTYLATVEEYDTTTNTWLPRKSMPTARRRLAVGVVNGKLYAVGGYNGAYLKTVEEYNPNTDTWKTVDSMPTPRHRLAVAVANGRLYAIGGQNTNGTLRTVEEFDPVANGWTPVDSLATGRYGLAADSAAGVVYALGGYNGSYPTAIEAFNLTTKTWSTVASQPTPLIGRSGLGLGVVNGKLYAVGGYNGAFLSTVEEYNPATNTWTTKQPLPSVRAALAAGVVNGRLYAVGGDIGGPALATVEVFVP